jgi:hypothetical protein
MVWYKNCIIAQNMPGEGRKLLCACNNRAGMVLAWGLAAIVGFISSGMDYFRYSWGGNEENMGGWHGTCRGQKTELETRKAASGYAFTL